MNSKEKLETEKTLQDLESLSGVIKEIFYDKTGENTTPLSFSLSKGQFFPTGSFEKRR